MTNVVLFELLYGVIKIKNTQMDHNEALVDSLELIAANPSFSAHEAKTRWACVLSDWNQPRVLLAEMGQEVPMAVGLWPLLPRVTAAGQQLVLRHPAIRHAVLMMVCSFVQIALTDTGSGSAQGDARKYASLEGLIASPLYGQVGESLCAIESSTEHADILFAPFSALGKHIRKSCGYFLMYVLVILFRST
jgi:hypothetical protein